MPMDRLILNPMARPIDLAAARRLYCVQGAR